jgi:hypothetical protein
MQKFLIMTVFTLLLSACGQALTALPTPTPTSSPTVTLTATLTATPTVTPTASPTPTPTRDYPAEGYGPVDFPANVNPLTGLKVADSALLERRPLLIKVGNLPREYRPQWGLSLADHVYEYYIEEGTTRFAAIFLGQDSPMVGPVRSARFFDHRLIQMYKPNFAFGSADYRVRNLMFNQSYADRLIIESACPPMCRFEPGGVNYLMAETSGLTDWINQKNVPGGNGRQNLDGFHFLYDLTTTGEAASQIYVRYSGAIYNRWDYEPETGKYLRFSETQNDIDDSNPVYAQLTDRQTGQPISADNVVVLMVSHQYVSISPEIVDIVMSGPDKAFLFREGQVFELTWYRNAIDQLFILTGPDGKPFPLKPGNTWFEVIGSTSELKQTGEAWRFRFSIP